MQSERDDDLWRIVGDAVLGPANTPEGGGRKTELIPDFVPLDAQLGAIQKATVPETLRELMFGENGQNSPLLTYAVLDAAKIPNLPDLLQDSRLEHGCLFNGAAYEELSDVAPWIVRLQDESSFTRNLFTRGNAFWHLWDLKSGIFLRSRCSLEELRRHFRKFTRLKDESENWIYFRSWEPEMAKAVFDDGRLSRFRVIYPGQIVLGPSVDGFWFVRTGRENPPRSVPSLDHNARAALREARFQSKMTQLLTRLQQSDVNRAAWSVTQISQALDFWFKKGAKDEISLTILWRASVCSGLGPEELMRRYSDIWLNNRLVAQKRARLIYKSVGGVN